MFTSRDKKVAFLGLDSETFGRMKGFTALTTNKNPREYTRQYVDQSSEITDVVGISTSMDFTFDQFQGNEVHEKLVVIIDDELLGDDAVVSILVVDFTKPVNEENPTEYAAVKRDFVVVPGTEGDNLDAYSYSGTFKAKGEKELGTATSTDDWETCTLVPEAAEEEEEEQGEGGGD